MNDGNKVSDNRTAVIIRRWKGGRDLIAIFPELLGNNSEYTCLSYELIGQHGACDPTLVMQRTHPTLVQEREVMVKHLKQLGYNPVVIFKQHARFIALRRAELKRLASSTQQEQP